jgi:hypothetical protein
LVHWFFKARVLYAPSDFKDEKNFLIALVGTHNVFVSVDEMKKQLEEVKSIVLNPSLEQSNVVERLNNIETGLTTVRQTAEAVASAVVSNASAFNGQGFSTEQAGGAGVGLSMTLAQLYPQGFPSEGYRRTTGVRSAHIPPKE